MNSIIITVIFILISFQTSHSQTLASDYPIRPVDFTKVKLNDGFWKSRVKAATDVTIPYAFKKCEETGRINNFIHAGGLKEGQFEGEQGFDDSDVYKILEGAAYSLMLEENQEMRSYVDKLVYYIGKAQEDDGYLYTAWSLRANDHMELRCCSYDERGRYIGSKFSHELYNVGHMYEAAVAHYQATGTNDFLDIAVKNADLTYKICVEEKQLFYPGHQEIELGLVKLYRATGEEKYLELAKLFLDRRGKGLREFGNEEKLKGLDFDAYSQDHKPVIEQDEAVGHSVRAGYMYASMADIAAITGDKAYLSAIDKIWEDIVSKKMYVTGGLGSGNGIEGFDVAYSLPNDAYAETCAAIANVYWNHRMFLLHGESKYIDVLERSLYNGLLAGLSLEGDKFFYPNPLEFDGISTFNQGATCRSDWFDCSCCPSNLARFIPSVAGYSYAVDKKNVYVNLFMNSTTEVEVNNSKLIVQQSTDYPWSGKVNLQIKSDLPVEAILKIRIPGWSLNQVVPSDLYLFKDHSTEKTTITINGTPIAYDMEDGYAILSRTWKKDDIIRINFPMEVKSIESHEKVAANTGKVAFQRGPIIFCAEGVDHQGHAMDLKVNPSEKFTASYESGLLKEVTVLRGKGSISSVPGSIEIPVQLIPYYAWSHREISPMTVWLNHD